ncbi:MAG: hypothetical protein ACK5YC_09175, partial [Planctomyces sp.]
MSRASPARAPLLQLWTPPPQGRLTACLANSAWLIYTPKVFGSCRAAQLKTAPGPACMNELIRASAGSGKTYQ